MQIPNERIPQTPIAVRWSRKKGPKYFLIHVFIYIYVNTLSLAKEPQHQTRRLRSSNGLPRQKEAE